MQNNFTKSYKRTKEFFAEGYFESLYLLNEQELNKSNFSIKP